MFDEFGQEDDQWRPDQKKSTKAIKRFFGIFIPACCFAIIGIIVIRLALSQPPKEAERFLWEETALESYRANPERFEITHILCSSSFSEDGMFSVSMVTYLPTVSQMQITLRINDRAFRYLYEDYPEAESLEGEKYVFALRDNRGEEDSVHTEYRYITETGIGYTYRRLIFDNVTMDDVTKMYLEVYYIGDADTEKEGRHRLTPYRYDYKTEKLTFTVPDEAEQVLNCPKIEWKTGKEE